MRWIVLLSLLALPACAGRHFGLATPDHFVELDEDQQRRAGYELRATSADGVVIGVRQIDNARHGSSAFWIEAIRNQLRRGGGYALLDERAVRATTGEEGHQMRFGRDDAGHAYRYWVTVFVTHDRIFVIEAGGRDDRFDAAEAEVMTALDTFAVH